MRTYHDRWVEPFPLELAAARLGIPEVEVRRRVQRGKLLGFMLDGQWRVWLPVAAGQLPEEL
jgi:hypothetical protein